MTGPIDPPTDVDYERSARESLEKRVGELEDRIKHLEERVEVHFLEAFKRIPALREWNRRMNESPR